MWVDVKPDKGVVVGKYKTTDGPFQIFHICRYTKGVFVPDRSLSENLAAANWGIVINAAVLKAMSES